MPLRHRLLDAAEGNPFFAEEIARRARDEGIEAVGEGRLAIPDTARAALAARIDRLAPADRDRRWPHSSAAAS